MAVRSSLRTTVYSLVQACLGLQSLRERRRSGPVVMVYHGVVTSIKDTILDQYSIDIDTLRRHIRFFKAKRIVISVAELVDAISERRPLDPRWLVLTFDDALRSQTTLAAEILCSHSVPWALSVPTGLVGSADTVWTYEVRFILMRLWKAKSIQFPNNSNGVLTTSTPHERRIAADLIINYLMHIVDDVSRDSYLNNLRMLVGEAHIRQEIARDNRFVMADWDDIRKLRSEGVAILSHGVLHRPQNSTLDDLTMSHEISASRDRLIAELQVPIDGFVFPNGLMDSRSIPMLKDAGYKFAFTTESRYLDHLSDTYSLPRFDGEYSLPVLRRHITSSVR